MDRKEREKRKRKNSIIKAAEKLFLDKGYENVSMDDIASRSQFTRKTLYAYFTSREELYLIVFMKISRKRWRLLKTSIDREKTAIDKLYAYGRVSYEYSMKYPSQVRLGLYWEHNGLDMTRISPAVLDSYHRPYSQTYQHLLEVFQQGVDEGSLRSDLDLPKMMVYLCLSLRTMVNEIILGYQTERFYFDYLDFFIQALQIREKKETGSKSNSTSS